MKRFRSAMLLFALSSAFAWAVPPQPSLTPVKATRHHAQRHHAHKAGKHRAPKRPRHRV